MLLSGLELFVVEWAGVVLCERQCVFVEAWRGERERERERVLSATVSVLFICVIYLCYLFVFLCLFLCHCVPRLALSSLWAGG